MNHDGARKVVELITRQCFEPRLKTKMLIPRDALKERISKTNDDCGSNQLRPKLGAFSNTARDDGGNGRRKRQQEEKLHQLVAVLISQRFGADHKGCAIRDAIADHKISHGGDTKIHQDLDQSVYLVFLANRT